MRYVCVILALFTLVGCETTQKIVKDRPWLAGLPGAVGGDLTAAAPKDKAAPGPALLADDEIVVVKDDGSKKLIAQTGRHLLIHIYCCLRDKDRDLFAQQVLSELTKADFRAKGKDPREALDMLIAQQDDIVDLCNAMPYAERTPGVFLSDQGQRVSRARLYGPSQRGLALIGIDMVMERGDWKLRWFVPEGTP